MESQTTKAAPVARQGLLVGTILSITATKKVVTVFATDQGSAQSALNNPQNLAVEPGKLVIFSESIGRRAYKLDEAGNRVPGADGKPTLIDVDPYLVRNIVGVYNSEKEVIDVLRAGTNLNARVQAALEASNEIASIEAKMEAKAQYADILKKYNVGSKEELMKALL